MRHTSAVGLVVVSAVIALVAALLAGGRLAAVESLPFRLAAPLGVALLCQVAGVLLGYLGLPAGPTYALASLASAVMLALAYRIDCALVGTEVVAAGLFLNALVIGANGNMPVSEHAVARAGAPASVATGPRHEPASAATGIRLLGEVIPVPLPLRPEVDSVGDLLIAAGLAQLVFGAVRPYRRRVPQRAPTPVRIKVKARQPSHSN